MGFEAVKAKMRAIHDYYGKTDAEKAARNRVRQLDTQKHKTSLKPHEQRTRDANDQIVWRGNRRKLGRFARTAGIIGVGGVPIAEGINIAIHGWPDFTDYEAEAERDLGLDGKTLVAQTIEKLPDTPVNQVFKDHLLPYFTKPTPFHIQDGNLSYDVGQVSVKFNNSPSFDSNATIFDLQNYSDNFHVSQTQQITIPFVSSIVPEDEVKKQPPQYQASDGTYIHPITLASNQPVIAAVYQSIEVNRPDPRFYQGDKKALAARVKLLSLEEAMSFFCNEVLANQTFKKMEALGLPTTVHVTNDKGVQKDVEVAHTGIGLASGTNGRTEFVVGAAGVALTLKAMEKDIEKHPEILNYYIYADAYKVILKSIKGLDFGTTPDSVVTTAINWARNYPEDLGGFALYGDKSKLP